MNMQVVDFTAHYKAVRNRLSNVPSPRERMAVKLYDEPIGPRCLRDVLHVASENFPAPVVSEEDEAKRVTFASIRAEVLEKHGLTLEQLNGRQRARRFVLARHELWYRAHKETKLSLPQMGRLSGDRDHTTILHGIQSEEWRRTGIVPKRVSANREASRRRYEAKKAARAAIAAE